MGDKMRVHFPKLKSDFENSKFVILLLLLFKFCPSYKTKILPSDLFLNTPFLAKVI